MDKEDSKDIKKKDEDFSVSINTNELSKLVSKWIDTSDDEESFDEKEHVQLRPQGVGLGAEEIAKDVLISKPLDPSQKKLKYKLEAAKKRSAQKENEAKNRLNDEEDDEDIKEDSKDYQLSMKRKRVMKKGEELNYYQNKSKVKKIQNKLNKQSQTTSSENV